MVKCDIVKVEAPLKIPPETLGENHRVKEYYMWVYGRQNFQFRKQQQIFT